MSDWRDLAELGYYGEIHEPSGTVRVVGFGVACTYAIDDEQALASLLDPDAHAERRFQHTDPDAHRARVQLEQAGYTVQRIDASADVFNVLPPGAVAGGAIAAPIGGGPSPATCTPDELVSLAAAELAGPSA